MGKGLGGPQTGLTLQSSSSSPPHADPSHHQKARSQEFGSTPPLSTYKGLAGLGLAWLECPKHKTSLVGGVWGSYTRAELS